MIKLEVRVAEGRDLTRAERSIESLCTRAGLFVRLKRTAAHPGSVHWHVGKEREPGTLEITLWGRAGRIWLKVHPRRTGAWIPSALRRLRAGLERQFGERPRPTDRGTVASGGPVNPDTIVTLPDTVVMFVAGEAGKPIAEQAPKAFKALEARLPSLRGRKFYGVVLGDEYRACVAVNPGDDPRLLPHSTWTLPGGKYVRRQILEWEQHLDLIGPTFQELLGRPDVDASRPCIEFYRSQKDLLVMVPVR